MIHDHNSRKKTWWFVSIVLLLFAGMAYVAWSHLSEQSAALIPPTQTACTLEAKRCSDGSYVGRTGPDCSFSPCPVEHPTSTPPAGPEIPADWQSNTSTDDIVFRYPEDIDRTYISTVDWPPVLALSPDEYTCTEAGSEIAVDGRTEQRTINGRIYCVTTAQEGAAGSVYTTYTYRFPAFSAGTGTFTFSLREVQCGNYDAPEQMDCEAEQLSFDLDSLVDDMAESIISTQPQL